MRKGNALRTLFEKSNKAAALACYQDTEADTRALITKSLAENQISASRESIDELVVLLGSDHLATRREIEKLCIYAAQSKKLTIEDIEALSGDIKQTQLNEAIDHALIGNIEKTLRAVTKVKEQSGSLTPCLIVLQTHLTQLQKMLTSTQQGQSIKQAMMNVQPRFNFLRAPVIEAQMRSWNETALATAQSNTFKTIQAVRKNQALENSLVKHLFLSLAAMAKKLKT